MTDLTDEQRAEALRHLQAAREALQTAAEDDEDEERT